MRTVFLAIVGFVLVEIYKANKEGRVFKFPGMGQISSPQDDPLPTIEGYMPEPDDLTIEQELAAIQANPGLIADTTPQGQFRIDPRLSALGA